MGMGTGSAPSGDGDGDRLRSLGDGDSGDRDRLRSLGDGDRDRLRSTRDRDRLRSTPLHSAPLPPLPPDRRLPPLLRCTIRSLLPRRDRSRDSTTSLSPFILKPRSQPMS